MTLIYSQLFDLVRRERTHQDLQELPTGFYEDAKSFFDELQASVRADPFAPDHDASRLKVVNGKKLLRQLYEYREQKILQLAQARCRTGSVLVDTSRLLPTERQLFEQLVQVLQGARVQHSIDDEEKGVREMAPPPLKAAPTFVPPDTDPLPLQVRIVKAVPQFLGRNMETYGPYEENAVVELPGPVAELLVRKGNAEKA